MVDFGRPYYTPMDQEYHASFEHTGRNEVEQPIFPISMVGQTVPEIDPTGRTRNIIEGVEAAFKAGAGNIQLVMQVPGQVQPIGGGPKAYGEEVRQAIREIQRASGGKITGVELPTQINNLSGFTPQGFNEEQRRIALAEVRDAIKFEGDIAGGGGVHVVSFEFPRNFSDASWKEKEGKLFTQREEPVHLLVNKDTGQISSIDERQTYYFYRDPKTFEDISPDKKPEKWVWDDFKRLAEKEGKPPELLLLRQQMETDFKKLRGEEGWYSAQLNEVQRGLEQFKGRPDAELSKEEDDMKKYYRSRETSATLGLQAIKEQEERLKEMQQKFVPVAQHGLQKSAGSYAEAGIWAMQESEKNQFVQRGKGSINVGPELGWPTYYGSHPQEFVELIRNARQEMARKLTDKSSSYYDSSLSEREAEQLAKQHIKGELDTSHLGMWLQNFKPELSWDKRVSEFKKWYKDQIEYIAKVNKEEDIISQIQIVDSASGAHGHLPPGEGILGKDIYEYMKILKEKGGYKGEFTSEGHEEEKFGQGRILTKAWETLGSPISSSYLYGRPAPEFRDIRHAYAQIAYGTTGIFQSYVPSNDFTLWSNVPFE